MSDSSSDEEVVVFRGWNKKEGGGERRKEAEAGQPKPPLANTVVVEKERIEGEIVAWNQCLGPGSEKGNAKEETKGGCLVPQSEHPPCDLTPVVEKVKRVTVEHPPPEEQAISRPSVPKPRPLSEPPQFNYDRFMRDFIPSEKRVQILFPDDVEKRTRCKDLVAEHEVLKEFIFWTSIINFEVWTMAGSQELSSSADIAPEGFCSELLKELEYDAGEVGKEVEVLYALATDDLAKWEYEHLDNDGGTTKIEKELIAGRKASIMLPRRVIFNKCERARTKYGYLCECSLVEWEFRFLDRKREGRRTSLILKDLIAGRDIFIGCEEARAKYGRIISPTLEQWEALYLDKDGGTSWVRKHLIDDRLNGLDIFHGCEDARMKSWEDAKFRDVWSSQSQFLSKTLCCTSLLHNPFVRLEDARIKYGWMYAPSLDQWETLFLDDDGGTSWIKRRLLQHIDIFQGCKEAAAKYAYLQPTDLEYWEYEHLDMSGSLGPILLRLSPTSRRNIFSSCSEARSKYGWIFAPTLEQWERLYLDSGGGVSFLKESGSENVKHILEECKEAKAKYLYLAPTKLEQWEQEWVPSPSRGYWKAPELPDILKSKLHPHFESCEQARAKYQHLAPPDYKFFKPVDPGKIAAEEAEDLPIFEARKRHAAELEKKNSSRSDEVKGPGADAGSDSESEGYLTAQE